MTFDPELCGRLIAEAIEDDAKATRAPWTHDDVVGAVQAAGEHGPVLVAMVSDESMCWDCGAIARMRNNTAAFAAQLAAACAEIERVKTAARAQAARDRALIGELENYVDQKPSREQLLLQIAREVAQCESVTSSLAVVTADRDRLRAALAAWRAGLDAGAVTPAGRQCRDRIDAILKGAP